MPVYVKMLTGKVLTLNIDTAANVWMLQSLVRVSEGIPIDQQRLICGGRQIEPGKSP